MGYAIKLQNVDFSNTAVERITYIEPIPCTAISLDESTLSFEQDGETKTLTATVTPIDTTDVVEWTSSNNNIATVENGVVTIHGIGSATITATCGSQTASASINTATLKAAGTQQVLTDRGAARDNSGLNPVLASDTLEGTSCICNVYTNSATKDVRVFAKSSLTPLDAIKVPYGATKMLAKFENDTKITANYIYVADTSDLVERTEGGSLFPKYTRNATFPQLGTGTDVSGGECFLIRIENSRLTDTLQYVYFT